MLKKLMKIAFDTTALNSAYKTQGSGYYVRHLKDALLRYASEHEYVFFSIGQKVPNNVDVVHFTSFNPFLRTIPLLNLKNTVITVHDLIPLLFPKNFPAGLKGKFVWKMNKTILRMARSIITDSNASKADIKKILGMKENKIYSIPLAASDEFKVVSQEKRFSLIKKLSLPEKFILYVGDATWNKNLPRIAQAVKQTQIPLVLVGKIFDENRDSNIWNRSYHDFEKIIEKNAQFIKLGFVDSNDLVTLYNTAQALLMPSLYEGFGLPVLEAMSCGCPVITSKRGSLSEVAGTAAVFVDPEDENDVKSAIERVVTDKVLRKKLSEKGFKNSERFSWKKAAEETIRVYLNAVK